MGKGLKIIIHSMNYRRALADGSRIEIYKLALAKLLFGLKLVAAITLGLSLGLLTPHRI